MAEARDPYFTGLESALNRAGLTGPTLVIDRDRLDANIDAVRLPQGMRLRVVAKSLPAPALLRHVMDRSGARDVMTFNLPMLLAIARAFPDAHQLLGKPLVAAAVQRFLDEAGDCAGRVDFLVDSPERLAEIQAQAVSAGTRLSIVIELDVGLRRGGFVAGDMLGAALDRLKTSPALRFGGFMGYEAHLPGVPAWFGIKRRAMISAAKSYRAALSQAGAILGEDTVAGAIRNAGGSPTFNLHEDTRIANEVSIGSGFVKPAGFDRPSLAALKPASFIATPVLKGPLPTLLPALEAAAGLMRIVRPSQARTIFIHGGNWLATPVDPPGLSYNATYGRSSNQEMLCGPASLQTDPGELVFFRPRQSEAVFTQFGDIAVYSGGEIVEWWPTWPPSA